MALSLWPSRKHKRYRLKHFSPLMQMHSFTSTHRGGAWGGSRFCLHKTRPALQWGCAGTAWGGHTAEHALLLQGDTIELRTFRMPRSTSGSSMAHIPVPSTSQTPACASNWH